MVISSSAIPAPPPLDTFLTNKHITLLLALKEYIYGKSICIICNKSFTKLGPNSTICGKECRKIRDLDIMHKWHNNNKERERAYVKSHRPVFNELRRIRRLQVATSWGINQNWRQAELDSVSILQQEGYSDIRILTNYAYTPFDIVGFKDNKGYVFQVTTRSHTQKKNAHELAEALKLEHNVLFVSTVMKRYVIKKFSKSGIAELTKKEIEESRRY